MFPSILSHFRNEFNKYINNRSTNVSMTLERRLKHKELAQRLLRIWRYFDIR